MPGFELIDHLERDAVSSIFEEGGVLFAHGFDALRKTYRVRDFEQQCSKYFMSDYALALSSGTAAIKCALKAVGVVPGDEVITQGFNFVATAEAIIDCGAIPVICDVNPDLHLDISDCISKITTRTSAIILVNMLGFPGPLEELRSCLSSIDLSIPIIEDACESVGAYVGSRHSGTCADIGVLSFDHGKNLTCGEGGLILTNSKNYRDYIASYSDHGHKLDSSVPRGRDIALMPGFNYRMTEMQAAVGSVQLSKLKRLISLHRERYSILERDLATKFSIRSVSHPSHIPSYDTFMLLDLPLELIERILSVLARHRLSSKNIPDAMYWHCSAFWSHALASAAINQSQSTLEKLSHSVAIPIMASLSADTYISLASSLLDI